MPTAQWKGPPSGWFFVANCLFGGWLLWLPVSRSLVEFTNGEVPWFLRRAGLGNGDDYYCCLHVMVHRHKRSTTQILELNRIDDLRISHIVTPVY